MQPPEVIAVLLFKAASENTCISMVTEFLEWLCSPDLSLIHSFMQQGVAQLSWPRDVCDMLTCCVCDSEHVHHRLH